MPDPEVPEPEVETIDVGEEPSPKLERVEVGENEWAEPPVVSHDQRATLEVARWVLSIFAGVYLLCFLLGFCALAVADVTYDGLLELIKFLLGSVVPLVTLAVGYYLGEKNSN